MAMIARGGEKTGNDAVDYIVASGTRRTEYQRFDRASDRARQGPDGHPTSRSPMSPRNL